MEVCSVHFTIFHLGKNVKVMRLMKIIEERETGLGSVTSEVKSLRQTIDKQRAELERTRSELRTAKLKLTDVTVGVKTRSQLFGFSLCGFCIISVDFIFIS